MGWTSYHATYYKNGKVDRKKECIAYFEEGLNKGHFKVEKSTMVGSVWYGAVRDLVTASKTDEKGNLIYSPLPENEQEIHGYIFLTSTNMKDYFNFSYKPMDEFMGPYCYDCPESILKLLSPVPEDSWAYEWREKCRENIKKRKDPDSLKNLPLGSVIYFENPWDRIVGIPKGTMITLTKTKSWGKRAHNFWHGMGYKWKESLIPDDYKIKERGVVE